MVQKLPIGERKKSNVESRSYRIEGIANSRFLGHKISSPRLHKASKRNEATERKGSFKEIVPVSIDQLGTYGKTKSRRFEDGGPFNSR
jgi:hypothetical protein